MKPKRPSASASPLPFTARHLAALAEVDAPRLSDADLTALLLAATRAQHAAYREMSRRHLILPYPENFS